MFNLDIYLYPAFALAVKILHLIKYSNVACPRYKSSQESTLFGWRSVCFVEPHAYPSCTYQDTFVSASLTNSVGEKNTRTCVNIFYWVFLFTRRSRWLSSWLKRTRLDAENRHNDIIYHSRTHTHTHTHTETKANASGYWGAHSHSHSHSSAPFPFPFRCVGEDNRGALLWMLHGISHAWNLLLLRAWARWFVVTYGSKGQCRQAS